LLTAAVVSLMVPPAFAVCACDPKVQEAKYTKELAVAEKKGDKAKIITLCGALGKVYDRLKKPEKATANFQRAIDVSESFYGASSIQTAQALVHYAAHYRAAGEDEKAEPLLGKAEKIFTGRTGFGDTAEVQTLDELALIASNKNEVAKAKTYFDRSLLLKRKMYGGKSKEVAGQLETQAIFCRGRGDCDAEPLLKEAIAIRGIAQKKKSDPMILWDAEILAGVEAGKKKYAEAEKLYSQVLAQKVKLFGKDSPAAKATQAMLDKVKSR